MARMYLESCSRDNRTINRNRVLFYAKQMKEGKWQLNGETIIFSDHNVLLNGYHRMNAVIEAGLSVEFLVVRGISEEAFRTIDTGKPRSTGDIYKMSDILNATSVAAIVRKYFMLSSGSSTATHDNNQPQDKMKVSNADLLDIYYTNPDTFQEFCNYSSCLRKKYNFYAQSEIGGIMCYLHLTKGYDKSKIYDFFNEVYQYSPSSYPAADFIPAVLLRERLIHAALNKQNLTLRYKQELLAKVWNLWNDGKNIKQLKIAPGEEVRFN